MRNCQRCGGEVSWTDDTVRMTGGVSAHLCTACTTEWDSVVRNHAAWDRWTRLQARRDHYDSLALAGDPVGEDAWVQLQLDQDEAHNAIHALGVEFVKPVRVEAPEG